MLGDLAAGGGVDVPLRGASRAGIGHPWNEVAPTSNGWRLSRKKIAVAPVHVRRDYEIDPDESLLKANLRQGVPHVNACGGIARCSTCRVAIVDGLENCGPRSPAEEKLTTRLFLGPAIRLACQTKILQGAVTVRRLVLDEQDIELTNEEFAGAVPAATDDERRLAVLFTDRVGSPCGATPTISSFILHRDS